MRKECPYMVCRLRGIIDCSNTRLLAAADLSYFNAYHPYAEHLQFLRDLVAANPGRAEIVTAGNSNGGRAITGIHFWGSGGKGSKPAIVLHGTVHAREWITGMVSRNIHTVIEMVSKLVIDR